MAIMLKGKIKKWGNSFGIVIPKEVIDNEGLKENQYIEFFIVRNDSAKVLKETYGLLKGRFRKSAQQMKDELREGLYDDD